MSKKVMQTCRKIEPKRDQNGSQNPTKIRKRRKKGDPKIDAKKEAKNKGVRNPESIHQAQPGVDFRAAGGFGGNGVSGFDPDLI